MRPTLLIGIALFLAVFALAAQGLRTIPAPSFSVAVAPESAMAPEGQVRWRATVTPQSDRDRLTAVLDRAEPLALEPMGAADVVATLEGLAPGYHFVEASVARRGGRADGVVDVIAAGPFQRGLQRGCDVALAMAPQAVEGLLMPALQHKVVDGAAQQTEVFGPTTYVTRAALTIVDGGVAFSIELDTVAEDKGDLAIAGIVDVTSSGTDGIALRLRSLERATPGPKLTRLASAEGGRRGTQVGVGGGAAIGGLFAGPGGALVGGALGGLAGQEVGKRFGKREASKRAHEQVYAALTAGLSLATEELRLPASIALLPTQPSPAAGLHWCTPLRLEQGSGIRAALRLSIAPDGYTEQALARAVYRGLPVADAVIKEGSNVAVEINEDLVNRLLSEWTVRGGLSEALGRSGLMEALQRELGARTRWQVVALQAELPPAIRFSDDAIALSFGGLALRLQDPERDAIRDVVVGGTGTVALAVHDGSTARLGGSLEQAYFGCRLPDQDDVRILPACFVGAVDAELIRRKINVAIILHGSQLPALDLADLVDVRLGDATQSASRLLAAEVSIGAGVVRLDATLGTP